MRDFFRFSKGKTIRSRSTCTNHLMEHGDCLCGNISIFISIYNFEMPNIFSEQENIPVGCVLHACQPYMLGGHQISVLVGGMGPQVNKCEQVSSDKHQMSLVGEPGCGEETEMRVPMF